MTDAELADIETRALRAGETADGGDTLRLTAEVRRLRSAIERYHDPVLITIEHVPASTH